MRKNTVILERRFVSAGSILISEGDEAHNAYLIQSGSVSVFTKTGEGKEVELARLGVGEICGEMALFNEKRRSASVRVSTFEMLWIEKAFCASPAVNTRLSFIATAIPNWAVSTFPSSGI